MSFAPTAPTGTWPFVPINPIAGQRKRTSSMFDQQKLLTLKFRDRSVLVPRDRCSDYDGLIAVARRSLRFLRHLPPEDLVVMALIEDIDEDKEVEVSKEAWPHVNAGVNSVTIALESELRSSGDSGHGPHGSGSMEASGSTSARRSASPVRKIN